MGQVVFLRVENEDEVFDSKAGGDEQILTGIYAGYFLPQVQGRFDHGPYLLQPPGGHGGVVGLWAGRLYA